MLLPNTSGDTRLARRIEEHGLVEVEGKTGVLAGVNAGIGAQAGNDLLAAELGDGECVRSGRFHDLDVAFSLGKRSGVPVRPFRVCQSLGSNAENDLPARMGRQRLLAGRDGKTHRLAIGSRKGNG